MMKLRFAEPAMLVDINAPPGLDRIGDDDGHLRVGAAGPPRPVVDSDLVIGAATLMAAPWIADPLVRNLGTIGGSLAHGDPEGDWASVMLALGARSWPPAGTGSADPDRRVHDRLLRDQPQPTTSCWSGVRSPAPGRSGGTYLKLERKVGDYATVGHRPPGAGARHDRRPGSRSPPSGRQHQGLARPSSC